MSLLACPALPVGHPGGNASKAETFIGFHFDYVIKLEFSRICFTMQKRGHINVINIKKPVVGSNTEPSWN